MLASLGLPGLMGFVAEFPIFLGAYQIYPALTVAALTGVVITVAFFLWTIYRIFWGPPNARWAGLSDLDGREWWTLAPLAVLMIAIGVYPAPVLDVINAAMLGILNLVR
jgi:NADH-quinone oxidoreductase subunit M